MKMHKGREVQMANKDTAESKPFDSKLL